MKRELCLEWVILILTVQLLGLGCVADKKQNISETINQTALVTKQAPKETPQEIKNEIESLIEQLGADDWNIREQATRKLIEIGRPAIAYLKKAQDSPDAEVRLRVNLILSQIGDLVAYWKFDEGSGTVAHDSSGKGNDGTVYGAVWSDSALSFDGADDYVDAGNNQSLQTTKSLTISAWIYPTGLGTTQTVIVSKGDVTYAGRLAYQLFFSRQAWPEILYFGICNGANNNYVVISPAVISQNNWYYVAVVFDRIAKTLTAYVDGEPSGTPASNIDVDINNVTYPVYIGRVWNVEYAGRCFRGKIAKVKIYSYALSAKEIQEDYKATRPK